MPYRIRVYGAEWKSRLVGDFALGKAVKEESMQPSAKESKRLPGLKLPTKNAPSI